MKPHFPGAIASLDPHKNSDKTELLWINHLIPYKVLKKHLSVLQQVLPAKATLIS